MLVLLIMVQTVQSYYTLCKGKENRKNTKKPTCSQKTLDFQKPMVLRLLTQVILLQTSVGTA